MNNLPDVKISIPAMFIFIYFPFFFFSDLKMNKN